VLDAALWHASADAADFALRRSALRLAWEAGLGNLVALDLAGSDAKLLRERDDGDRVLICLPDGLAPFATTNRCIDANDYAQRAHEAEPDDVAITRFWIGVLGAERLLREPSP
jgi:hypothetical protein